jgi:hypothetical protein
MKKQSKTDKRVFCQGLDQAAFVMPAALCLRTKKSTKPTPKLRAFTCEGTKTITDKIHAKTRHEAAIIFRYQHGVLPECIGDKSVLGVCEVCGLPIFSGEDFVADTDGVTWHKRCPKIP